jgi:hypothetical protein
VRRKTGAAPLTPDARWGEFVLQFDDTEQKILLRRDIYDVSSARRLVSKPGHEKSQS